MNKNKRLLLDINSILEEVPIESSQKIADLGCGNFGYFIIAAAKMTGSQGLAYAVDIQKPHLREVQKQAKKENLPQIKTIWTNLEKWKGAKIENNSLDVALLINTLNQSDKRADILRESTRMIKKKGKLLIVEWLNKELPFGPKPEKKVKKDAIIDAAPKLGLKLDKEFSAGEFHYGLLFSKL
ncbi:class I SAM-dependent methyltransferase [Patescibacteria group bacterium]|nr:class I SAM-dependent methyltransferase [Patescibacteria group bacterium]